MKLAVCVLACLAAVAVQSTPVHKDNKAVDSVFLKKQKFIFEILHHVGEVGHVWIGEWIKHGENLIVDNTHYMVYNDLMTTFYETYKVDGLLPKNDFFSAVNMDHIQQAKGLFNFFYYAKGWETFVDNVVWARININQGMFVYALTLAVMYRDDTTGIVLPAIYEIFPQSFFNSKFILEAERFDSKLWNKQIMYEKQMKTMNEKKHVKNVHDKNWYMKDWKMWQWWKIMGLDQEWHSETKYVIRETTDMLKDEPMWITLWNNMKMVWMPVDYTRDVHILNDEAKLSYFTEDLGLNAYWYYLNMDYSPVLSEKEFNVDKDHRGEWWIFNVEQLLARYYMERLSHGMGDISELTWHGTVDTGYNPELIAYNGVAFTLRKNYWEIESHEDVELLNQIVSIDRRIDDAIAWGKFTTKTGAVVELTKPESIEYIGSLMQGNLDIIDRKFFGYWLALTSDYLSGHEYHGMTVIPSVFSNYETMLRDPLFFHLIKRAADVMHKFQFGQSAYKHDELLFKGVAITDVKIDKMMTYFDLVDFDVSNLENDYQDFESGNFYTLLARQMRLNHKPYTMKFTISSDKAQKVIVRTFLGPGFDEFGRKINLIKHHENLMKLDEFTYDLAAGENLIERSSNDYDWTVKDRTTYSELYKLMKMAVDDVVEFPLGTMEPYCGFPDRLILPRGWVKGMPMQMFFMVSPDNTDKEHNTTHDHKSLCGIGSGMRHSDNLSFGYPFDRKIDSVTEFSVPNMLWKEVKIYHVNKFDKYYEHKFEHFGTFDYNFN